MGKPGPLPKDHHLRVVDNDNKNRMKPGGPKPSQVKKPIMPPGLDPAAKREWKRVADPLFKLGVLTELDKVNLAIYCQLISKFERYEKTLEEKGEIYETATGMLKPRPEVAMRDNCLKEIRQFVKMFGLSHDARCRMELPQADSNELNEFESLLD